MVDSGVAAGWTGQPCLSICVELPDQRRDVDEPGEDGYPHLHCTSIKVGGAVRVDGARNKCLYYSNMERKPIRIKIIA